jgi:uncharacterized membrane protein
MKIYGVIPRQMKTRSHIFPTMTLTLAFHLLLVGPYSAASQAIFGAKVLPNALPGVGCLKTYRRGHMVRSFCESLELDKRD